MLLQFIISLFFLCSNSSGFHNPDLIVGRWMSLEKNLIVDISKNTTGYSAQIVWFDDSDDKNRPLFVRTDFKNPDESQRNRKVVGLNVLYGLKYNAIDGVWEEGRIYDPSSGRTWSATIYMYDQAEIRLRGFWHFEILGRNMIFKRVSNT